MEVRELLSSLHVAQVDSSGSDSPAVLRVRYVCPMTDMSHAAATGRRARPTFLHSLSAAHERVRAPHFPPQGACWVDSTLLSSALVVHCPVLTRVAAGDRPVARFQIGELELYWRSRQHTDYYAHCDEMKKRAGYWYMHKHGVAYRAGSFKGLEIACGNEDVFGGLLVRGLRRLGEADDRKEYIDGPSLCVDALITVSGADDVQMLGTALEQEGNEALFESRLMRLVASHSFVLRYRVLKQVLPFPGPCRQPSSRGASPDRDPCRTPRRPRPQIGLRQHPSEFKLLRNVQS